MTPRRTFLYLRITYSTYSKLPGPMRGPGSCLLKVLLWSNYICDKKGFF